MSAVPRSFWAAAFEYRMMPRREHLSTGAGIWSRTADANSSLIASAPPLIDTPPCLEIWPDLVTGRLILTNRPEIEDYNSLTFLSPLSRLAVAGVAVARRKSKGSNPEVI